MILNWERTGFGRMSQDEDCRPHWSPLSQGYTSAEVLLTFMCEGWKLERLVTLETYFLGGHRRSDIYRFTLQHDDEPITIPVLANPVVYRIIDEYQLAVKERDADDSTLDYVISANNPSHRH